MKRFIPPFTFVFTLCTLIITAGFFLLIAPEMERIGRAEAQLQAKNEAVSAVAQKTPAATQAETNLAQQAQTVGALLPTDTKPYEVSVQVEALAKDDGVALSSLSVSGEAAAANLQPTTSVSTAAVSGITTVSVQVKVQGTLAQVEQFLTDLPRLPRYLQVQTAAFAVADANQMTLSITATGYALP